MTIGREGHNDLNIHLLASEASEVIISHTTNRLGVY